MEPTYLTTQEAADRLRTTPETLRFWRHVGKGPRSFKAGKRVLYDATDIDAWVAGLKSDHGPNRAAVS